jgi:DNA-binding transcriptional MerR regulator
MSEHASGAADSPSDPRADPLLGIGEVAKLSGLTSKALRHYDRIGLLRPESVDPVTNYRYYSAAGLKSARLVQLLRSIDLPLDEVRTCLSSEDPKTVTTVLTQHRHRLDARATRIRGHLHLIDHKLADPGPTPTGAPRNPEPNTERKREARLAVPTARPQPPEALLPEADERRLAVAMFNDVWRLIGTEDRTPAEDDQLLHQAHASRHHWQQVGEVVNHIRGEWLCSRVYAVLGRAEPAVHHARRALQLCQENEVGDWDLAFAHEALARAYALSGDSAAAGKQIERARTAATDIAEDGDRALLLSDLETIPGEVL